MTAPTNNSLVQPYLFFDGRCDEALDFYTKTLGAKIEMLMRFKDSPDPNSCAPGTDTNKVMHASFRVGNSVLMASDGHCTGKPTFAGFGLSLSVADEAEAQCFYKGLEQGGQVVMPLTKTFFSPSFGMVNDKFGVCWMIMVAPPIKPFSVSRTFDAPRDQVWKAWTERERLMQWFGPKGFTMSTANLDFRPGGSFHYALKGGDGKEMWGKFIYRVIEPQNRIVLVSSFSDAAGSITRHPMSATWPREMLSTSTFTEENGKTTLTLEWMPLNPTDDERKTFEGAYEGMKQGWNGTFEQLTQYLAKG